MRVKLKMPNFSINFDKVLMDFILKVLYSFVSSNLLSEFAECFRLDFTRLWRGKRKKHLENFVDILD